MELYGCIVVVTLRAGCADAARSGSGGGRFSQMRLGLVVNPLHLVCGEHERGSSKILGAGGCTSRLATSKKTSYSPS